MILEMVNIQINAGQEAEFERVFAEASRLLASAKGYISHELQRCIETPGRYVNLVRWESVDDHMLGFRGSPAYQEFRALVTPYYAAPSQMEHYTLTYRNPA
jgi:heme-degrading monooxygenase HmoA